MCLRVKIGVTADEATSNPPAGNHNSTINTRRTINTSSSAEEDGKQNLTESYCAMRKKSRFRESVANKAASERQANDKQAATTLPSIPTKPFNTIIVCRGGRCMIFWNLQIKQKIPEAKASGNLLSYRNTIDFRTSDLKIACAKRLFNLYCGFSVSSAASSCSNL